MIPLLRAPLIYNKPVVPGSASYTTPGTYSLIVPNHNSMTFDPRGAGGGGGGAAGYNGGVTSGGNGSPGGYSQVYYNPNSGILNVVGYGGNGGGGLYYNGSSWVASNGSPGTATGGDSNINGGGNAGGSGGATGMPWTYAGSGGYGGRAVRTMNRGILVPGQTLIIIVGSGGAPGAAGSNTGGTFVQQSGSYGSNGAVYISWT